MKGKEKPTSKELSKDWFIQQLLKQYKLASAMGKINEATKLLTTLYKVLEVGDKVEEVEVIKIINDMNKGK